MGMFMKHNDILIGSMLDQLNLRFAPPQGKEKTYGGIEEMAVLQKEFEIFRKGRPFATSFGFSLNAGCRSARRWFVVRGQHLLLERRP